MTSETIIANGKPVPLSWGFAQVWNDSVESGRPDRENKPREHVWASEIGGAMIDRYLKMTGVKPTNPPNARSQRKFEAGNIWECIVGYVLRRAGILVDSQEWLEYQYPGLLRVTGKLDFLAGGKPDYDKAVFSIQEMEWLPEFVRRATLNIVNKLKEEHPSELKNIVLEIKSCSSFMFDVYERRAIPSFQHQCQLFHYLKAKNMPEGHIVYISRDDARILEIGVFNPSLVETSYKKDIAEITGYIAGKTRPALEKPIVFDEIIGKFSANWRCGYSGYLTMLYGLKDQAEFDERYKPIADRWNRVVQRIAEGKPMTENNKQALDEMEQEGFPMDKIKEKTSI